MTLVARVFTFISGGQDTYLSKALESFDKCCWGLSQLIFGASAFASSFSFHGSFTEYDILESDFFDVFFAHGAFRLLSYITVITWGIRLARKGRHLALLMVWAATCFY